jgi:hypothetical protein
VKLTLNVLEDHSQDKDRHWPGYIGGRIRTSTAVLIVAFFAAWWAYETYRPPPEPSRPSAPQVVPPGFLPDPNYTWVPRTRVQPPPTYYTPTPTPTTTVPTTTPPTTTTTTMTTTPPPLFQLPVLPPPFGPGTSTTPTPAPPGSSPAPGPIPGLPLPGG